ncbi:hypothetical protein V8G54_037243 [Vigna mungo]|uniref:Leucine-rich repeat-containing N-terminal plant-type domain-containing protein n=1 Tax=Vigna mungo TaxID=3915 RepID=A0AAQ3MIQ4_VIGMU
MFNTAFCSFNIRCNQQDMHALLNFKQGVTDPLAVLSSWTTQLDCCHWKGVICSNITSRVTGITLPCSTTLPTYRDEEDKSHCLTGSIRLSLLLVELEFLEYLNLRNNDFLALQFDYLHNHNCHNLFISTSSHSQCVNSSTLRHLDISDNSNIAINNLKWLPYISTLEYLNLCGLDLSKETNWLQLVTKLSSLSVLRMCDCQLKDLSLSLQYANFTALQGLDLSFNEFMSELPKWLFNLSSTIHTLYFTSSSLIGHLPMDLLNLRELEDLVIEANNFDGSIPDWLGDFKHLKTINLCLNMFSGSIPTNLGNLSTLITLDVGFNTLTGVVTEKNLAKLSKLKSLYIYSYSTLIFDFDSNWIPPFQLEELVLGFSNPELPAWFYTQRSIESLTIFESSFEAPHKFWNFVSTIDEVRLEGNLIDGDMSNVLLNSTVIDLSWNGLKGCLPRLSPNVVYVSLSNNSLSGELSPLLCDHNVSNGKNNLLYLDISLNNISGGLTNCWMNWKSLVVIHLGSNNLSGKISSSLGFLFNLTSLHLHENNLHGEIPLSLHNCHSLLIFNVRNNQLSGNIPDWIPHGLLALQLRSNHFSGKISPQICEMSSLIVLDIAQNTISDHIPSCLGNIKTLLFNNVSRNKLSFQFPSSVRDRYLIIDDSLELVTKGQVLKYDRNLHFMTLIDMSSNNLSGKIPSQMFSLIGLSSLNLSNNKLEGEIPNEIGNMKNLESLDFSTNQFRGEIPPSLSTLSFLGYLNLSFNNLTGKIPSGTQLQGFTALSYMGNHDLCGPPLAKICFQNDKHKYTEFVEEDGNQSEFLPWFYIGMESGFVTGFLGVCCSIFLSEKLRHAFFKFLYDLKDRLHIMVVQKGVTDLSGVLSSWTTQLDCCHWKGVICSNITSRVIGVTLPCSTTLPSYRDEEDKSHCLTGSINLSLLLVELEFLEYLNLRNNDFLALQFDYLHNHNCHNLFIPTSSHSHQCVNYSTLRHLDLERNKNLVINNLKWLPYISTLEYLNLCTVDLSKETNWLQLVTKLSSLSELAMCDCQLKDLSLSLQYANFTALQALDLSYNEFKSELPKWLFNLSSTIHTLYFTSSSLIGHLPKDLLNLRELEDLVMDDNNFDGPIPDWLGHFKHLKLLILGENMFSGSIPTNWGNLSTLIILDVGSNTMTGVVSERNLAKLSKLKSLYISSYSTLIFDFDSDWIPPFQLEELVIGFSNPDLPAWLYTQRSLERLSIRGSSFEAPDKFWHFVSSVIQLELEGNLIDGDMSNVLLNSTYIYLSSNGLKGCLPQLSANVVFVSLSNNLLSGELSPLLCGHNVSNGKNNLLYLDISLNNISGGLTNCWKNWKSLVAIHLGRNNLSGKIPSSLGFLSNLNSLHLHENKLHGDIPLSLRNCHSLLVFNVRNNQLSGNIPAWISHGLLALQLRSNHFSGKISPQICEMSSLIVLDIAQNTIFGHIPSCLGNIKTLLFNNVSRQKLSFQFPSSSPGRYYFNDDSLELVTKGQVLEYGKNLHFMTLIDMSSNNFSGTIPPQMFSLIGLHSLNLSNNKLAGEIPNEIGNMKNLESLDFSTNQLCGEIPQSLSRLSFLGYLNLSFNNLTGKIPSGTQLEGFTTLSYMGNHDLCGPPLTKICFQGYKHKDTDLVDEVRNQSEFWPWFYIGMESGFVTGFLGVCCAIFLNKKLRHAFFKFLYDLRY